MGGECAADLGGEGEPRAAAKEEEELGEVEWVREGGEREER